MSKNRRKSKKSIIIPPLIDVNDFKWLSDIRPEDKSTKIKLLYAGDIGDSKDNIEEIIQFLKPF